MRIPAFVVFAALAMSLCPAMAPAEVHARNVVLVRDADGPRWAAVIALLEKAGLQVATVDTTPSDSAQATRHVLILQSGPAVLVGSRLDTIAGIDSKIAALVYVAAQVPEAMRPDKPSFYAVANRDKTIAPALQRADAARMKAKTIVLDAGHRAMESHPREIAGLILDAAGIKPPACGSEHDDGQAACMAPALPRSIAEGCKCTKEPLDALTSP